MEKTVCCQQDYSGHYVVTYTFIAFIDYVHLRNCGRVGITVSRIIAVMLVPIPVSCGSRLEQ